MGLFETKFGDHLYVIFRIGIGVLFLMHGVQKLLGLWGMQAPAAVGSIFWFAAISEVLIGPALIFGVLTRLASFFGIIEMLVAYFVVHVPMGGLIPAVNKGEPALLFLLAFLVTLAYGARKASLEQVVLGKEVF